MDTIKVSHTEAHEKLTARLFFKLLTEAGYADAGNVKEFVDATSRSIVTRAASKGGFRITNDEQVDLETPAYTFQMDEHSYQQGRLIKLARITDNVAQAVGEGTTATITGIAFNRWFTIGSYGIENVTVTGSVSGLLEEGADYDLDKDNGRIYIKPSSATTADSPSGQASDGETLTVVFDRPSLSFQKFTSGQQPLFQADVIIELHSQHSKLWLYQITCRANIIVTEFPTQSGEFGMYKCRVAPIGNQTILKRGIAATLLTQKAASEGPGKSSSSSSSSSASDNRSSSSSGSSQSR